MHHASRLVLPGSTVPWPRPTSPRRGSLQLTQDTLGVKTRAQLRGQGWKDYQLTRAVRGGSLRRIAPGWYAEESAAPKVTRSLSSGHRLTCISATRMHGIWTPYGDSATDHDEENPHKLHVYCDRSIKVPPRGMAARHAHTGRWPDSDPVASLPLALEHAIRCQSGETAAVLLESAIERRLLTPAKVQLLVDNAPSSVRSRIGTLSSASDSGSETRVARWLRSRGFRVEQQPFVAGVGYLDAYVAGLFLEIDGRESHEDPETFTRDRARDLTTSSHGLQVLRISYDQVWRSWADTKDLVLAAITEVGPFGRRKVSSLLAQ